MIRKLIGPEYPKTSCECSECPQTDNLPLWPASGAKAGDINNVGLSTRLQMNNISQCSPTSYVRSTKGPNPWSKNPITILNPNFGLEQAPGFFQTAKDCNCGCDCGCDCTCPVDTHIVVSSNDSRLISPLRGPEHQDLNRAPWTGNVRLKDIYDEKYTNYGKNYTNYKDIHSGQIMYYLDKDLDPPFSLPVYTIRSNVQTDVFKTPMGGVWPQYTKVPTTQNSRYVSPQQFTRDTVYQREDIMALQQSRYNRERYGAMTTQ